MFALGLAAVFLGAAVFLVAVLVVGFSAFLACAFLAEGLAVVFAHQSAKSLTATGTRNNKYLDSRLRRLLFGQLHGSGRPWKANASAKQRRGKVAREDMTPRGNHARGSGERIRGMNKISKADSRYTYLLAG